MTPSRLPLLLLTIFPLVSPSVRADDNLLPNGSFEDGMAGWRLSDGSPKFVRMGTGQIVTDHVHHGAAAFLYEKTVPDMWYPQLWTPTASIEEHEYYEAGLMIDTDQEFTFRHTFIIDGQVLKFSESRDATDGWQRVTLRFRAPEGCTGVKLGFQMVERTGRMWIDDVRLTTTAPFEDDTPGMILPGPPADKIHNLQELALRTRIAPTEHRLAEDKSYPSERLVFQDTATGTTIWKMSHTPGSSRHRYSNMPVWNADGSKLVLRSNRDTRGGYWLVEADGSNWSSLGTPFSQWNRSNPDLAYWVRSTDGEIHETNIRTGNTRLLWKLPVEKLSFIPPSHDGKKLLVVENSQSRTAERSYAWLMNADGSGEPLKIDLGTVAHQTWFLKRDDYSFMFNDEVRNTKNQYQDTQWICEPLAGGAIRVFDQEKHFSHAGVSPSGDRVAHHRSGICLSDVFTGDVTRAMRGSGGHLSWQCDDRWLVATMGNNIHEIWVDEKRTRRICVPNTQLGYSTYDTEAHLESSPDGTKIGYASSMMGDIDFYVAVQRLPDSPRNVRIDGRVLSWDEPEHSLEVKGYLVYTDQRLLTPEPSAERRFVVPDPTHQYTVTAVEYSGLESSREDAIPPATPTHVEGQAASSYTTKITWAASSNPDFSHYHVYASSTGIPTTVQERRIASPTDAQTVDWGLQAETTYHYVVTAVDRAGNESTASEPVRVHTPPIQRVLERINVGQLLDSGETEIALSVPRDDTYVVWAELKPKQVSLGAKIVFGLDNRRRSWIPTWDFVCIGHGEPNPVPFFDTLKQATELNRFEPRFSLTAGEHTLSLTMPNGQAELISLTVTNDQGYVPDGITDFRAERVRGK